MTALDPFIRSKDKIVLYIKLKLKADGF